MRKDMTNFHQRFMEEANYRRLVALKMHGEGKTYEEIGAALGVSKQRAYDMVRRAKMDPTGVTPYP
jgi:transposase